MRARLRQRWDAASPRVRRGIQVATALLLAAVVAGLVLRGVIGEQLWPSQRAQELRMQAEAALDAGRLSAADGSGARELFEAALALQPDQVEARAGLGRVAVAALAQARLHADDGRIAHARIALRLAQDLQAPRADLEEAARRLGAIEADNGRIALLLERADAALEAGRLDGADDAALPLFQRVVLLQPRNEAALEGREDALADLLAPVPAALERGDIAGAADLIRRAERFDTGHAALPPLRAELGRAIERENRRIDRLIGSDALAAAASACLALRTAAAGDIAGACTSVLPARLLQGARLRAADFDFSRALAQLEQARALGADAAAVAAAEARLQQAIRESGRLAAPAASARTARRVGELLAQAELAGQRGQWLAPPGDSAWDRLRQARALAPDDPRVVAALRALLPNARRCTHEGLRDNNLGRAQACLEAWQQLAPGEAGVGAARQRLAERWLAVGTQRLADGDIEGARAALARARGLQPTVAGGAELADRLQRAGAGRD